MLERIVNDGRKFIISTLLAGTIFFTGCAKQNDYAVTKTEDKQYQIAFVSGEGSFGKIQVINTDGTGLKTLSDKPSTAPSWSPDGKKLVFVSDYDIWVMNADGSKKTRLTRDLNADHPLWSPEGKKIAFESIIDTRVRDVNVEIRTINADGTGLRRLTNNHKADYLCGWSPDGSKILFVSNEKERPGIYTMNANGSGKKYLSRERVPILADTDPHWSPDGRRIVFCSNWGTYEIHTMNADGTEEKWITATTSKHWLHRGIPEERGDDRFPSWSPDGKYIAFDSEMDGNLEIYRYDILKNGWPKRLTANKARDFAPVWTPDGKIVFISDRDGNNEVCILDGRGYKRLTHNDIGDGDIAVCPVRN